MYEVMPDITKDIKISGSCSITVLRVYVINQTIYKAPVDLILH